MASTSRSSEVVLRKFHGTNFSYWMEQMQDYLIVKGQIDLIENATTPSSVKPEEWTRKDRATIRMHLSESVYYTVQSYDTAHALWKILLSTYEKKTDAKKIYLVRRLYNLRMKESDSVTAHLGAYKTTVCPRPRRPL